MCFLFSCSLIFLHQKHSQKKTSLLFLRFFGAQKMAEKKKKKKLASRRVAVSAAFSSKDLRLVSWARGVLPETITRRRKLFPDWPFFMAGYIKVENLVVKWYKKQSSLLYLKGVKTQKVFEAEMILQSTLKVDLSVTLQLLLFNNKLAGKFRPVSFGSSFLATRVASKSFLRFFWDLFENVET